MNKHTLFDYLSYANTLVPDAEALRDVANTDWWITVREHFDHLIWQHWFDRTVLFNMKYPFDPSNPDDTDNMDTCVENIIRAFTINLRSNARKYEKMYKVFISEYDPLYNVDAHEFEHRTLAQTGTDTSQKSGDDTLVKSGNYELEKLGTEVDTRTGNEQLSHTGTDSTVNQKTTYDDTTFRDTDKTTVTPGVTDTTTYNSVADTKTFTGRKDKTTFNSLQDKTTYGSADTNTKDLLDTEDIERRRFGNIGVTKSSELLIDAMKEAEITGTFIYQVVHDCVNTCTYMVD